jgi:hypothetical protein
MNLKKNVQPQTKMSIAMLGTLPPLRGLSSYCLELAPALASLVPVEFISFKKLLPRIFISRGSAKRGSLLSGCKP